MADADDGATHEGRRQSGTVNVARCNALLGRVARLAGWPTPAANDDNEVSRGASGDKKRMGERDEDGGQSDGDHLLASHGAAAAPPA